MQSPDSSPPQDGFLAPVIDTWRLSARASTPEWFCLINRLNRTALGVLQGIAPNKSSDRELIAAALFARAVQSFEASILLAERGMLSDAGTLSRSVIETTIFLGGLALIRDFHKRMAADNKHHFFGMAKGISEFLEKSETDEDKADAADLRALVQDVKDRGHDRKGINLKEVAAEVGMEPLYQVVYRQLSGNSAHPSITTSERHFARNALGNVEKLSFSPQRDGLEKALSVSITGLLGAMEAMGTIFNLREVDDAVNALNADHQNLAEQLKQVVPFESL